MTSEHAVGLRHQRYLDKSFKVRVTEDVSFGVAGIGWTSAQGTSKFRSLLLDIYEPDETPLAPRPALVLAFGGAFQRGTRKNDVVGELPHRNTAISEYCREFARRGYLLCHRLPPHAGSARPWHHADLDRWNVDQCRSRQFRTRPVGASPLHAANDDRRNLGCNRRRKYGCRICAQPLPRHDDRP
jgi:hypothetical protein